MRGQGVRTEGHPRGRAGGGGAWRGLGVRTEGHPKGRAGGGGAWRGLGVRTEGHPRGRAGGGSPGLVQTPCHPILVPGGYVHPSPLSIPPEPLSPCLSASCQSHLAVPCGEGVRAASGSERQGYTAPAPSSHSPLFTRPASAHGARRPGAMATCCPLFPRLL